MLVFHPLFSVEKKERDNLGPIFDVTFSGTISDSALTA
jgi:hypothetical protein